MSKELKIHVKGIERNDWERILSREFAQMRVQSPVNGYIAIIHMLDVAAPMILESGVKLVDAGYTWLQVAPMDKNYWLTVIYDEHEKPTEYYFDITVRNFLSESGEPCFEDLFLDLVVTPDGEWTILDEDELDQALETGVIGPELHAFAWATLNELMDKLRGNEPELGRLCAGYLAQLKEIM